MHGMLVIILLRWVKIGFKTTVYRYKGDSSSSIPGDFEVIASCTARLYTYSTFSAFSFITYSPTFHIVCTYICVSHTTLDDSILGSDSSCWTLTAPV